MSAPPVARGAAIARLLARWTELAIHAAPLVVLLALAAATAAALYAAGHLGIDTNTVDMLSPELPWRVESERHKRAFPHYADNIVVVIEGATPDLAAEAQGRLGNALAAEPGLFEDVHLTGGGPFFERNALLYVDSAELEDLAEGLEGAAPWLGALERDPSLGRFLTVLDSLLADDLGSAPLLGAVGMAFDGSMVDRVQPLPWRDLMSGGSSQRDERRRYIEILPRLDFEQLLPGEPAIARIHALSDSLSLLASEGVSVRLTGFVPMSDEELRSSVGGLKTATLLALLMVGLILYAALRSGRLIAAALLTLLVGLLLTAGFAALAVGSLNLISMAFAVLYIGLGIDYAIHYSLRYRELRTRGAENREALKGSAADVGTSLLLSAFTTAVCFYAFVPTDFEGVSELGLIGGTGMLISFATTVTLLPALLSLLPFRPKTDEPPLIGGVVPDWLGGWVSEHRRGVLVAASLVGIVSLILLPRASFDLDPLSLRDPEGESTATFRDLLADSTAAPLTISLLAKDREETAELSRRLEALDGVDAAIWIQDLVPEAQQEKMALIQRIGRVVGPAPAESEPAAESAAPAESSGIEATLQEVELFRERVRALELAGDDLELARFAVFQIRSWQRWTQTLPDQRRERAVQRVEESLFGGSVQRGQSAGRRGSALGRAGRQLPGRGDLEREPR
jgi:hopanoid biosynthesis associated RND transporter like protein HpnN